jgi:hypothetical protein
VVKFCSTKSVELKLSNETTANILHSSANKAPYFVCFQK